MDVAASGGLNFNDLLNKIGSTAIDVYKDRSTSKLENRKVDTKGAPIDEPAASGFSPGVLMVVGAVVGLVLLVLLLRR